MFQKFTTLKTFSINNLVNIDILNNNMKFLGSQKTKIVNL